MRTLETEVLVIGGGATGTGVARDLAMRGFQTILVEKRDLSHGTTGRYHGLLHSGGRYAVKDPQAAAECIRENQVLRRIMPHCLEDTSGFFVLTPEDDPAYVPLFIEGCRQTGIAVEEVSIARMLKEEPLLSPDILRCFRVPDAAADSFLASEVNADSARQHGAQILNYHEIKGLIRLGGRITGATCHDVVKDEQVEITADMVVNASGAWAGKIAGTAGVSIEILPGKGTMVAVNHRIVNTVINRCKMPSDGDILVPIHTVSIIGTTDLRIPDPDRIAIEPWEIRLMLEEGEKLVPGFQRMRMLRAWAGVRPLYHEGQVADSRDVPRSYVLLDHEPRDGVSGLVTITSGKWTTYRLMAEATVDLVCEKLDTTRPCRTHLEPLPGAERGHFHHLGVNLQRVESEENYGSLVCECELARPTDIVRAIVEGEAKSLDDIRREARLGMGPCQGGFCTYRAAGIWHALRNPAVEAINVALRDFLQERWKGLLPILWGSQLRQERLDELIYLSVLNADHLPGAPASQLAAEMYALPDPGSPPQAHSSPHREKAAASGNRQPFPPAAIYDVVVIGGGLAGLVAAWRSSQAGLSTKLITRGWGATHWNAGCIDVLGYLPGEEHVQVENPRQAIEFLQHNYPGHPYALAGIEAVEQALTSLQTLSEESGYPLDGSLDRNWLLPSALGVPRPTCLAPRSMVAGDLRVREPVLLVGFDQFLDFYPALAAENINRFGIPAQGISLDLPGLRNLRSLSPAVLAQLFETEAFLGEVIAALKLHLGRSRRVGFPAILGMQKAVEVHHTLEEQLGRPVFEIPGLPPSIPGIRMHNLLSSAGRSAGAQIFNGMLVLGSTSEAGRVDSVWSEAAARRKTHPARAFVLAIGGILGGGLVGEPDGKVREIVFNLELKSPVDRSEWFSSRFSDPLGHPVYRSGVPSNSAFQPVDEAGNIIFDNLFAAGGILSGGDYVRERSLDGVALVTGLLSTKNLAAKLGVTRVIQ